MIRRLIPFVHRMMLLGLLALGLGLAGHAHRAPSAQDTGVEAGLLAGFALADLCGQSGDDGMMPSDPCPACTLAGLVVPPGCPVTARPADLVLVAVVTAPRARRSVVTVLDPAHASRAPPFA